jgi:hypothetical protein
MMKTQHLLILAASLGLGACAADDAVDIVAEGPATFTVDQNTFTVLAADADADGVVYRVRTPDDLVRELRYDATAVVGVYAENGTLVAGDGVVASLPNDARLATLDLPSDPRVGYAAMGFDVPLPSATEAPDAVMPDGLDAEPYEVGCSRQSEQWVDTDGCTYGYFIDTCDNGTFWGSYQKKSGCAFLGFFCDCPGGSDGGQL